MISYQCVAVSHKEYWIYTVGYITVESYRVWHKKIFCSFLSNVALEFHAVAEKTAKTFLGAGYFLCRTMYNLCDYNYG